MVVPWPAGGTTDVATRRITARLEPILGQAIVVENRVGAMGTIGSAYVARAQPDGYTLLRGDVMTHVIDAVLMKDLPYDPVKDFAPVSGQGSAPMLLLVNPSLPVASLADLVALAKSRPGQLNYAVPGGLGIPQHIAMENLRQLTGINLVSVLYKGEAPALTDLVAGHVQVMFAFTTTPGSFVKAGKLRALLVTDDERIGMLPDVPTAAEAGYPQLEMSGWGGFFAPAGTPGPVVQRLHAAIQAVLVNPEVKKLMDDLGAEPMLASPDQFGAFVARERIRWEPVVRKAGIQLQ
jgi:tripartite-type tricarboxylate transporter receptor subunit TctC